VTRTLSHGPSLGSTLLGQGDPSADDRQVRASLSQDHRGGLWAVPTSPGQVSDAGPLTVVRDKVHFSFASFKLDFENCRFAWSC
jgi:hypothetical protein